MLTKPHPTRKLRPAELRGHVMHRAAVQPGYPLSTAQGVKSLPASACACNRDCRQGRDCPADAPLSLRSALLSIAIVGAGFAAACVIVNFLAS